MRILKFCLVAGALLGALFSSGCATVTRGRTEQLTVLSEPSGASIRLSNGNTGVTPATFIVPRKGDVYVTVFKDGYETAGVVVPAKISSNGAVGFLGNAIVGGVLGGGIDVYTGATLSHTPNPVVFKLVPKRVPAPVVVANSGVAAPALPPAEASKAATMAPPPPAPQAPAPVAVPASNPVAPMPAATTPEPVKPPGSETHAPDTPTPPPESTTPPALLSPMDGKDTPETKSK
jgi:hypothetical protein